MDEMTAIEDMEESICHSGCPMWRCTRPDLYTADCSGRTNKSARQGHYVRAPDADFARSIMERDYPGERIDVQTWR